MSGLTESKEDLCFSISAAWYHALSITTSHSCSHVATSTPLWRRLCLCPIPHQTNSNQLLLLQSWCRSPQHQVALERVWTPSAQRCTEGTQTDPEQPPGSSGLLWADQHFMLPHSHCALGLITLQSTISPTTRSIYLLFCFYLVNWNFTRLVFKTTALQRHITNTNCLQTRLFVPSVSSCLLLAMSFISNNQVPFKLTTCLIYSRKIHPSPFQACFCCIEFK